MNSESKTCQNCKQEFTIEPEDFTFYEKIKVPPPTFCSQCRSQRRMAWRNERSLYKRKCNAPEHTESIISMYAPETPMQIYDQQYWWGDGWDPLTYGRDYDFNKSFFEQWKELLKQVPLIALANRNAVNSEWCNPAEDNKDCYLSFGITVNENVNYSNRIAGSKDCFDLYLGNKNQLCSNSLFIENCTGIHFCMYARNCLNSFFLYDCNNCSDCIGCTNLRSKKYCILNREYSKEDYFKKVQEINLENSKNLSKFAAEFKEFRKKFPHRRANLINTVNSTGDNLWGVKGAQNCFDIVNGMENCKFCTWGGYGWKDSYDGLGCNGELAYEVLDGGSVKKSCSNTYFSTVITDSMNVQYCHTIRNSSNIFGCIGLNNKEYCILNRQYSKEEYEKLVPKIIEQMNTMPYIDSVGRKYGYGEFFPAELSPWAYNETVAQEYFPLTETEAITKGFRWRKPEKKHYNVTISENKIPETIKEVGDSIVNEVIECAHKGGCNHQCTTAFKIIDQEFQFYRRLNIPLPNLCPNCRHYARLAQRNPLMLWTRKCQCAGTQSENGIYKNSVSHRHGSAHCLESFETSYAPDRPEIIYCEQCYQQEVM